MKIRFFALLLMAVMTVSLLAGCGLRVMHLPKSEQLDASVTIQDVPDGSVPLAANPTGSQAPGAPQTLTEQEILAIALTHAGFAEDEVRALRVEPELWDRIPHFDVEFTVGRWEYEYEIHAETGAILSFDRDD